MGRVRIVLVFALQAILHDPTTHSVDCTIITTPGANAAKTPALRDTAAKPAMETTLSAAVMTPLQKLEARLSKSHQTAKVLLSMKPQTPVNISLLTELLRTQYI